MYIQSNFVCIDYDIAYDKSNFLTERSKEDRILEIRAWEKVGAKDSSYKDKDA